MSLEQAFEQFNERWKKIENLKILENDYTNFVQVNRAQIKQNW